MLAYETHNETNIPTMMGVGDFNNCNYGGTINFQIWTDAESSTVTASGRLIRVLTQAEIKLKI